MYSQQQNKIGSVEPRGQQTFLEVLDRWIRRYIIDDDPYDTEAWKAALLYTQTGLHTEAFPKEFY